MENIPIILIHGANATKNSFSYLKSKLNYIEYIDIEYTSYNSFYENLEVIKTQVEKVKKAFVVGHSLGGLYGVNLLEHRNIIGGVSISTPFGGSYTADWARFVVPTYPLFKDVGTRSKPIISSLKIKIEKPWLQIVTTQGHVPYHGSHNDGVVTIKSMTRRDDVSYHFLEYNHYEVMCSDETVSLVENQYKSLLT